MTTKAIINADDFGLSPGVNRGIVSGFRDGVLTSTTMLVNLPHFEDAVNLARDNPDLPVGIHLSLLWGRPVSEPHRVPTLIERDGCFPDLSPRLRPVTSWGGCRGSRCGWNCATRSGGFSTRG